EPGSIFAIASLLICSSVSNAWQWNQSLCLLAWKLDQWSPRVGFREPANVSHEVAVYVLGAMPRSPYAEETAIAKPFLVQGAVGHRYSAFDCGFWLHLFHRRFPPRVARAESEDPARD